MDGLGEMFVTDFIDTNIDYIERVVEQFETEPMSFNTKARLIQEVLMKGTTFGLAKGGYIERCRKDRVDKACDASYRKWMEELVYEINEVIEAEMKKKKYKKKY